MREVAHVYNTLLFNLMYDTNSRYQLFFAAARHYDLYIKTINDLIEKVCHV